MFTIFDEVLKTWFIYQDDTVRFIVIGLIGLLIFNIILWSMIFIIRVPALLADIAVTLKEIRDQNKIDK